MYGNMMKFKHAQRIPVPKSKMETMFLNVPFFLLLYLFLVTVVYSSIFSLVLRQHKILKQKEGIILPLKKYYKNSA